MQTFQNKLLALAGVVMLALIGSLMNSRQTTAQAAGSAPVTIVGPLPLPVTGSSTVTGTVAATQSGSWNVGITNTAAAPVLVRDVDNAARQPFQADCNSFASSNVVQCSIASALPLTKQLVIQNVSLHVFTDTGVAVEATLSSIKGSTFHSLYVPLENLGSCTLCVGGPVHTYVATTPVTLYPEPGSSVFVEVDFDGTLPPDGMNLQATVSGYFVNLP